MRTSALKPRRLLALLALAPLAYLGIALALVLLGKGTEPNGHSPGMDFSQVLNLDTGQLPPRRYFIARDGTRLGYRLYNSESSNAPVLVLLHGSSSHSAYMQPLAHRLASSGSARVYTPDLRGHGPNPHRRGDVDYIGQLEDDLNDMLGQLRERHPDRRLILAGHSSGGGLVIRHAGGKGNAPVDGHLLLAPYIHHNAPTHGESVSAWASPNITRMVGLGMLNGLGLQQLNHLPVLRFHMPESARDGTETLAYSYRLQTSLAPRSSYPKSLAALHERSAVLIGAEDRTFRAEAYPELFERHAPQANVTLLPGLGHLELVTAETTAAEIRRWLHSCCTPASP